MPHCQMLNSGLIGDQVKKMKVCLKILGINFVVVALLTLGGNTLAMAKSIAMPSNAIKKVVEQAGLSEGVQALLAGQPDIAVFLRIWSKAMSQKEYLDTASEERIITSAKLENLKAIAAEHHEFKGKIQTIIERCIVVAEDERFAAIVNRRAQLDETELPRRMDRLKDMDDSDRMPPHTARFKKSNPSPKAAANAVTKNVGKSTEAKYAKVLDPPGVSMLISKQSWDARKSAFVEALGKAGGKVVSQNPVVASRTFLHQTDVDLYIKSLSAPGRVVAHAANSKVASPDIPFFWAALIKMPPGTKMRYDPSTKRWWTDSPEFYTVEQDYLLVAIEPV